MDSVVRHVLIDALHALTTILLLILQLSTSSTPASPAIYFILTVLIATPMPAPSAFLLLSWSMVAVYVPQIQLILIMYASYAKIYSNTVLHAINPTVKPVQLILFWQMIPALA